MQVYGAGTPDEWTEHIQSIAVVQAPESTAEAPEGATPTRVSVEWHTAVDPDGLEPPHVRLDIETDCFGVHYCSSEAAREMAAALLAAADRLDEVAATWAPTLGFAEGAER
ncbi:hypothetical protein [Cellulomonas iranensis]|uniref:hypothetical protein n=1 Tax=Cellulomonas iranensis TaxID=76862 RepID=UPI003D7D01BD